MRKRLVLLSVFCLIGLAALSQTATTQNDGAWNDINTWDTGIVPTSSNTDLIIIQHNVNVPSGFSVTVDSVSVEISATLTIDAGGTVTVASDGTNADDLKVFNDGFDYGFLTVNGTLICNNSAQITGTDGTNATFNSGSIYRHLYTTTQGSILGALWNVNSTVQIQGYTGNITATAAGNWGQSFGNFTFNCAGLGAAVVQLAGFLTDVQNDLTISATGTTGSLRFSNTENPTVVVGRDLIISGTSRVLFGAGTATVVNIARDFSYTSTNATGTNFATTGLTTVNVGRDFTMNATGGRINFASSGNAILNVTGNFTVTAGQIFFGSAGAATGTANLSGNFSNSGTLTENSTSTSAGNINFVTSAVHTFTNSGTISQVVNFSVASLSTLDMGTSAITGAGTFTLNGTLRLGALDGNGALQAGISGGNIRTSGTPRTYASNSTIVYNGSGPQFIGDGFPTSGAVNLTINNSSGVTLSTSLDILALSQLALTSGNLTIGTQTLTINGTVTGSGGIVGGPSSNMVIGGTGNFGTLTFSGTNQLLNFTLNRTSTGLVTLGGNLTILGIFTHTAGDLNLNGRTLQISGNYSRTGGTITGNSASSLIIDATGTLSSFSFGPGSSLNTLTMDRALTTLTTGASLTVTNLNLLSGIFNNTGTITMASGGTITRDDGTMSTSPLAATTYDVHYTNGNDINSGPELSSVTTAMDDVLKEGSGSLTLTKDITVNGTLRFNEGTFDADIRTLTLRGNFITIGPSDLTSSLVIFAGTSIISGSPDTPVFGNVTITGTVTPNTNHQINGNLINNGTLNAGGGTLTFGGTSTILGSSTSTFNNIVINTGSSLTAHATAMNLSGNLILNGTGAFNHNSGTVNFTGTTSITGVPTFNHMNVTGTLNGPSTLNAAGNFINSGTFNPGSGIFNIAGNYTNSGSGTHSSGSGNLNISGSFTNGGSFTAGSSTVRVAINFTNNSTFFNAGTGTVIFNGTNVQSISGSVVTNFNNISVTNTAGPPAVQVQSNQNLTGILTLASNAQFDADGSANTSIFTLISSDDDPTVDASIAAIPSGAGMYLNSPVTVQRYMSIEGAFNGRIYRFISSPVDAPAASQIQTEIPITGTFTGSSTCQGCNNPNFQSMLQYNENVITDSNGDTFINVNDGFADFPATANTEPLENGRGYTIYVRADIPPISTAGSARWDVRARINSGTINYNSFTTFTSSGTLANDGWNYVGNPYPSTIDWDAASGWTRTGINNAIYMKDNGSNLMASYVGGVQANGGTRFIAMGQGYVVKSDGGTINFQTTENVKVAGTQTSFIREAPIKDLLRIALNNGSLKDETVIRFTDGATEGFDNALDAYKYIHKLPEGGDNDEDILNLKKSILNFSSISAGAKWVINALPKSTCSATIPLDVSDVVPGTYSLEFSEFETFEVPVQIRLIDNFLGESIDVTQNPSYSFEVTADPNSFGNRFSISFGKSSVVTDLSVSGQDVCAGSNAAIHLAASQSGVTYFASIDGNSVSELVSGNGSDLSITINDANLATGSNNIMIMAAYPGCDPVPLNQKIMMKKEVIPHVISVQDGTNCREGQLSLSASGAPADGWYNWYETEDAITGIDDQHEAQFITPTLNKTKTYYVSVSNALGCEGPRAEVKAEVIHYEDAVVTVFEDRLVSSYNEGNQWFKDGQEIPWATGKELVPTESGRYGVSVSVGPCSTGAEVDYLVTSTEYSGLTNTNIYPNPTNSSITIEVQSSNEVTVDLYNPLGLRIEHGIKLKESKKGIQTGQINFTSEASGFYIVKIKDGLKTYQKKILKK